MFSFHSFAHSCPVFPKPLIKETVFSPLYILASFVIDKVLISVWIYPWAFYNPQISTYEVIKRCASLDFMLSPHNVGLDKASCFRIPLLSRAHVFWVVLFPRFWTVKLILWSSWRVVELLLPRHFSHVSLFVMPWTTAHQASLATRFFRQECWSGFACPPPGDLPDTGIKPVSPESPALEVDSLLLSHWGSPEGCAKTT